MKPKHIPQRWPSMKERFSCGCCVHYRPFTPCPLYGVCKGGMNGAKRWVYSEKQEELTKERDRRRQELREMVSGLD